MYLKLGVILDAGNFGSCCAWERQMTLLWGTGGLGETSIQSKHHCNFFCFESTPNNFTQWEDTNETYRSIIVVVKRGRNLKKMSNIFIWKVSCFFRWNSSLDIISIVINSSNSRVSLWHFAKSLFFSICVLVWRWSLNRYI